MEPDEVIIQEAKDRIALLGFSQRPELIQQELAHMVIRLKELVREMAGELHCKCSSATATVNGEPVTMVMEKCAVCKILNLPEVREILEG